MSIEILKGTGWMFAVRLAERGLGIVSTLILARLLVPSDFGLIAMAMTFIGTLEVLGAFNFDMVLIGSKTPTRAQYDTAFTLNVIFRVGSSVLIALMAYPAALFYNEPRLFGVMLGLALAWFFQSLENIGIVNFRISLEFNRDFYFQVAKKITSFLVTLSIAFAFKTYWSLVLGMVAARLVGLILSYTMDPYRPSFTLSAWRSMMKTSSWLLFNNILNVANLRLGNFIIGKLAGSHDLGLYTVSKEIGTLPTSELAAPVERATLPVYARYAQDKNILRKSFVNTTGMLAMLALPAAFGIAALSTQIVLVCLSQKWIEAIPILQILGFIGAATALSSTANPVLFVLGKVRLSSFLTLIGVIILVPAVIYGGKAHGILGVAWAELLTRMMVVPCAWLLIARYLSMGVSDFINILSRPLCASIGMFWGVQVFHNHVIGDAENLGTLLLCVIIGGLIYVTLAALLWLISGRSPESPETKILEGVQRYLQRKTASASDSR